MKRSHACLSLACLTSLVACIGGDEPATLGSARSAPSEGASPALSAPSTTPVSASHPAPKVVVRSASNAPLGGRISPRQDIVPSAIPANEHRLQPWGHAKAAQLSPAAPTLFPFPEQALDLNTNQVPQLALDIILTARTAALAFSGAGTAVAVLIEAVNLINLLTASNPDLLAQFQALSAQLNQVAGSLSWEITENTREQVSGNLLGDLRTVRDLINLNEVPIRVDSAEAQNSQNAVAVGGQPLYYARLFSEAATDGVQVNGHDGAFSWKGVISDRAPISQGFVYDWRLGVPWYMTLVDMRLPVMASEDPNFLFDGKFSGDTAAYAATLASHMSKMRAGIHCKTNQGLTSHQDSSEAESPSVTVIDGYEYDIACADIYTGASEVYAVQLSSQAWPFGPNMCQVCTPSSNDSAATVNCVQDDVCAAQQSADFQTFYNESVAPLEAKANADVTATLPLGDMQQMFNFLDCGNNCC